MSDKTEEKTLTSSPFKGERGGPLWQVADPIEYKLLKENAKANRNDMTEAEAAFWQMAKGNGLGQKCRRQYIIGQYIVDFFFRQSMLIVELDGGYHFTEEQQQEDAIRQDWLEHIGYRIIRFTNEEVLFDTENVAMRVKENLIINNSLTSPSKGDREGLKP